MRHLGEGRKGADLACIDFYIKMRGWGCGVRLHNNHDSRLTDTCLRFQVCCEVLCACVLFSPAV